MRLLKSSGMLEFGSIAGLSKVDILIQTLPRNCMNWKGTLHQTRLCVCYCYDQTSDISFHSTHHPTPRFRIKELEELTTRCLTNLNKCRERGYPEMLLAAKLEPFILLNDCLYEPSKRNDTFPYLNYNSKTTSSYLDSKLIP
jgi:hypothetical protein